jgi:hypothetical protein
MEGVGRDGIMDGKLCMYVDAAADLALANGASKAVYGLDDLVNAHRRIMWDTFLVKGNR